MRLAIINVTKEKCTTEVFFPFPTSLFEISKTMQFGRIFCCFCTAWAKRSKKVDWL